MVPLKYASAEIAADPSEITSPAAVPKFLSTMAGVTNYILRKAGNCVRLSGTGLSRPNSTPAPAVTP